MVIDSILAAAAKKQSLPIQRQMMRNTLSNVVRESEIAQSCPTLCDPMACSLPGSSILGIFQARILEWVAIFFSSRSSQPRDWTRIVGRGFTVWATKEVNSNVVTWRQVRLLNNNLDNVDYLQ